MTDSISKSKRIAKNTVALYIRMLLTMLVGLYTSRVILDALGVEDYGIYNLVGGFVTMFSVVQSGLVSASQRFINTYLGIGEKEKLHRLFSTIVVIYLFLTLLAFILVESLGVYFLENQLNIPVGRIDAAKWTFHFSVIILMATLFGAPFQALIVSHERMEAFAYISIFDSIAKLIIAELIYFTGFDKLIVYSLLLCILSVIIQLVYWVYCRRSFEESKITLIFDWKLIKEIYAFAIWSMLGGFAFMGFTQGVNVLLGMFFSPSIVAARGIAIQVQGVVKNFSNSFQTAVNPQIIKSYAQKEYDYFEQLLLISSKYSFLLLLIMTLPFIFEANSILGLWLVEVPQDTSLFLKLILLTIIFDSMTTPYERAIHASGRIKKYSISTSLTFLTIVPISFVILKLGARPYSVFIVHLVITLIAVWIRMRMANILVNINLLRFLRFCLIPVVKVSIFSIIPLLLIHLTLPNGVIRLIITILSSIVFILVFTYIFGMSTQERETIVKYVKTLLSRYKIAS